MPRRNRKDKSKGRWKDDYIPLSIRRYVNARAKRYRDRRNIVCGKTIE